MGKGIFLYNNLFSDKDSITVTSENSDFPKSNMDSPNPRKLFKANANGLQVITLDMGAGYAKGAEGAFFNNVNLSPEDVFYFEGAENNFVEKLSNTGFETAGAIPPTFANWSDYETGTGTITDDITIFHGGSHSCQIYIGAAFGQAYVYQACSMTVSKKHCIKFWYKMSGAGEVGRLRMYDSAFNVYLSSLGSFEASSAHYIEIPNATVWTLFQFEFTSHGIYTGYYLELGGIYSDMTDATINIDDVSLIQAHSEVMTLKTRTIDYLEKKAIFCEKLSWSAFRYLRYYMFIDADKVEGSIPYIARDMITLDPNYKWGYRPNTESVFTVTKGGQGMETKTKEYDRFVMAMKSMGVGDTQKEEIDLKLRHSPYVLFLPDGITGEIYYGILDVDIKSHRFDNNWTIEMKFKESPYDGRSV